MTICILAVVAVLAQGASLSRLPEGPGIAARYPGDAGIARHPAVLFADGFETVTGERLSDGLREDEADRSRWNHAWDHAWGGSRAVRHAHTGRQAVELATPGAGSVGLTRNLHPGRERLFMRYYIRYAPDFPGAHHVGGAIEARAPGVPHANPGVPASGANKITVLLDHWTFEPGMTPPGPLVAYVYHMDQQHQWGEQFYPSGRIQPQENERRRLFGDAFVPRPDLTPQLDRWICLELMVDAGAPGARSGRVAFWVDGRLRADFPNLRFRTTPDLKLNRVDLQLYESRSTGPRRVWIDDVVVATQYIGPLSSPRRGG
ncbi:MAG TPA: hypothetical protein VLH79_08815 [Chthonomonadales bacterium]|nr:hypothetical protein [Chthonomonadales bacterium]